MLTDESMTPPTLLYLQNTNLLVVYLRYTKFILFQRGFYLFCQKALPHQHILKEKVGNTLTSPLPKEPYHISMPQHSHDAGLK